jgi:flagella synthesis protein FlgN
MNGFRPAPNYDVGTLQAELAGYRSLLDVLHQEQDALRRADADALPGITAAKQREVQGLSRFAAERARALDHAGKPAARAAADALLVDAGAVATLVAALWDQLEAITTEARRVNAVNGTLIATQQSYFSGGLSALSRAAGAPATYGADGRPHELLADSELRLRHGLDVPYSLQADARRVVGES